ncbi:MAG: glycosyltransferase, partial [Actinomycetota bacterium]|nr:glycosyltransferase [Actinomycetota bacterium]
LSVIGVPAVLVPLPGAPRDHQTKNAMVLVKAGAAVCVKDSELDGARLVMEVEGLLADPQRLLSMSIAARELGIPDASDRVAGLALRHASGETAGANR